MVRHAFWGFLPWGPRCFVSLFARALLYFERFSVEWGDLVGDPRGAEPPLSAEVGMAKKIKVSYLCGRTSAQKVSM